MLMKKYLKSIIMGVAGLFALTGSHAQTQKDSVQLELRGNKGSKTIVMLMYSDNNDSKSARLMPDVEGRYLFNLPNTPFQTVNVMLMNEQSMLVTESGFTPKPRPTFLIEAGKENIIELNEVDQLNSRLLKGGEESKLYEEIAKQERKYAQQSWEVILKKDSLSKLNKSADDLKKGLSKTGEQLSDNMKSFVATHKNSVAALEVFSSYYTGLTIEEATSEFDGFSKKVKGSELGKVLAQKLLAGKSTNSGEQIPNFQVITKDGKSFNSKNLEGKYWLIDFWGSWCAPCRASHPELKALYEQYKDENFDILGVAFESGPLDNQLKQWGKAIDEDGIQWHHVLNNKENELVKKFGVTSFPTKLLVDPSGKIIYRSTGGHGEDLANKLVEVFSKKEKVQ